MGLFVVKPAFERLVGKIYEAIDVSEYLAFY